MGIFTKLRRCCLQLENLKKLIFWPSDFEVDCRPPSNLVELFEKDIDSKEELLKEFKDSFQHDEVMYI